MAGKKDTRRVHPRGQVPGTRDKMIKKPPKPGKKKRTMRKT